MPIKLFKNKEDKMKKALLFCDMPTNEFILNLAELSEPPFITDFVMVPCAIEKIDYCPMEDLLAIQAKLHSMKVGLAWFEEPEILFASLSSVSPIRTRILQVSTGYQHMAWWTLVRLLWDSGVELASVTRYLEGYGIETFVKGGKAKKAFLPRI